MNTHIVNRTIAAIALGCFVLIFLVGSVRHWPSAVAHATTPRETPLSTTDAAQFSPFVDRHGNIRLPSGYARGWAHLGSWAVAKKPGEAIHEIHEVYTQPDTIVAFQRSGEFPDGAVLVKEVRKSKADRLTTGHSSWSTQTKIWFVMVKDAKGRFEGNDHWGDGWGWALFEAKDPGKNVSAGYATSCLACHSPVEKNDWVYTYGYPELSRR